ncbi:MAG: thioredoxin [Thermosynechococcaceae cyanobacterium]
MKKGSLFLPSLTILAMALALPVKANTVTEVTEKTLKEDIASSDIPVLVDFWAPWCTPCRQITPVVNEIAEQYEDQIKVVKVNVDENPSVDTQYKLHSIPTLMIFKGGKSVNKVVGIVSKTELAKILEKYLQPSTRPASPN